MSSPLADALRRALDGGAKPRDVVAAVVDIALAESCILDGMTTAEIRDQSDRLQAMLDDLLPAEEPPVAISDPAVGHRDENGVLWLDPDDLPPGVVLLKDEAKRLRISRQAIRDWIKNGRLKEVGRVWGKGSGATGFIAVRQSDVDYCWHNPRKRGPQSRDDSG